MTLTEIKDLKDEYHEFIKLEKEGLISESDLASLKAKIKAQIQTKIAELYGVL